MQKILGLLALLTLAACDAAPTAYQPEALVFSGGPLRVNVAEIKVVENYVAPLRAPNVEQDFPVAPAVAVRQWVAQRLVAVGTDGVLEAAINDASVKEVKLPKTTGIQGFFTDDQDARYDANLKVSYRLYSGAQALSDASADVAVSRSRSIHERATVDERERIYHGMTREMMADFDAQATTRLHQYFAAYLR